MFRLRYSSGEEAIFRSVEELALGLRSGIIGTDTFVLDNAAHVWQPLSQHPQYSEATAIAATLNSYGDLELESSQPMRTVASGEFRSPIAPARSVYQMASISGSELQARRNQKRLLKAGIFFGAALVVATSGFMIWKERSRGDSHELEQQHASTTPQARRSTSTPTSNTAYWLSPGILAARRTDAQARVDQVLIDSSMRLPLDGLISIYRLRSTDSLRLALTRLQQWRDLTVRYRAASAAMVKAYQDTANLQLRTDQWSLLDANDWKSRSPLVEDGLDTIAVDSLLSGVQKLYDLLLAQQGKYTLDAGHAEFDVHRARIEYARLSGIVLRHGPSPVNNRDRTSLPLSLLRRGLEGQGLPALPPESAEP